MNGAAADFDVEAAKSVGERLKQARIAKGFESATKAAEAFGWNENTYRSHENGMRGLKLATVRVYAKAFDVDPTLVLFGDGNDEAKAATKATCEMPTLGSDLDPDRVRQWIRDVCARMKITPTELARRASISHTTLSRFLAEREGIKHLSGSTLAAISSIAEVFSLNQQNSDEVEFDAPHLRQRIEARLAEIGKTTRGAAREVGLSESSIRNIMEGKSQSPRLSTVIRLCKALDVSQDWLMESAKGERRA